jgi:putative endonuclease
LAHFCDGTSPIAYTWKRNVASVSDDRRHTLGAAGEQLAAEHLERRGFAILERNFRTRWGELDLVAYNGRVLAFCEVKTRRAGGSRGSALEAVGPRKQAQVRRMAACWLAERRERPRAWELRLDAIGITVDGSGKLVALEHLEGAF